MSDEESTRPKQEEDLITGRTVTWFVAGSVLLIVLTVVISWLVLGLDTGREVTRAQEEAARQAGQPRPSSPVAGRGVEASHRGMFSIQPGPVEPDSAARKRIEIYGWVDRSHDIARVPVETAMGILARMEGPDSAAADSASTGSGKGGRS